MIKPVIESICIFGSCARGSADSLSDRDVLIVSSDYRRRTQLAYEWKSMNWSVASYCPSRFHKLVEAGSLFVQHLKHEGLLYRDKAGWLKQCLASAIPKDSYSQDAANSVLLALPIERFLEDARIRDHLVAADMAYIAIRNFGVCHLADKGKLSFDYSTIVSQLRKEIDLDARAISLLTSLRAGKVAYRGGTQNSVIQGSIGQLREVLSKIFVEQPLREIDSASPTRWLGGGYAMLRDFEASVLSTLGHVPTSKDVAELRLGAIWKWVRDPRRYSWGIRNLSRAQIKSPEQALRTVASTVSSQPGSYRTRLEHFHGPSIKECSIRT